MNTGHIAKRHPLLTAIAAVTFCIVLSACGGDDDDGAVVPPPPPPPAGVTYDVAQCLDQTVPGTNGGTVAGLVIPDVLRIDPAAPGGFPNGRLLTDPVIDVILAALFLDLNATGQSPLTLANLPLNPPANDVPFRPDFPYLAPPQGTPPIANGTGRNFDFRTDPASQYVRVDRTAFPALSTALISSGVKTAFNDASPANDVNGRFVDEMTASLTALTEGIGDDLLSLNLDICAD